MNSQVTDQSILEIAATAMAAGFVGGLQRQLARSTDAGGFT